ncbi:MAG: hypothetical protein L0213_00220, partial [Candidatus Dadabacteria bacterium]|nr:hypothetical protein [Candidatus Dadabacteria bacterium]
MEELTAEDHHPSGREGEEKETGSIIFFLLFELRLEPSLPVEPAFELPFAFVYSVALLLVPSAALASL